MKKVISVMLALVFIISFAIKTLAVSNKERGHVFITEDNKEIKYYLDEHGMPYKYESGQLSIFGITS